ncbi:glycosyltransferase [Candidatus Parcubacteria bacterium]|nr:MAG: glycosyltransferase [Candidatus Parcubacteria bacterium]
MNLSIVLSVFNEEENLEQLYNELKEVLSHLDLSTEIICVNDGSFDNSLEVLKKIALKDDRVKVIDFVRNFGQTAAMSAGIKNATGEIIIPMDADLQNNPKDIPHFLEKINEGYVVVSGWRKERKDKAISRRLPSWLANKLISLITGVKIHDYGCSMKAYKKSVIQGINLYGEMHRFIPAYVAWNRGKITEIVVDHRPRIHGQTKYGISRTFRVILDLIVVKFLSSYMNRPIHFFGGIGIFAFLLGCLSFVVAVVLKLANIRSFVATPLPIFSALLIIVGVQLIVMGILSEMQMRTYYESQKKDPYSIKEKINF